MSLSKLLIVPLVPIILSGCMSPKLADTTNISTYVENKNLSPQQACEMASLSITKANKESLHFYAPLHLERASDTLEEAHKQIKVKETEAAAVKNCYKVTQLVESGITIKAKVKHALSDSLAQLDMLSKVDKEKGFTSEIQDYSDDLVDIVKEIEASKMNKAMQNQAALIEEMIDLEIEIVTVNNLATVEVMLERAEDIDADDLAERTFEKAEIELKSAKKFIQSNYRNNKEVEEVSASAMQAAKHAFYVAQEVEELQELKADEAEEKVLYIESLFERINKRFDKNVVIGNSLYDQAGIIVERLDEALEGSNKNIQATATKIENSSVNTK